MICWSGSKSKDLALLKLRADLLRVVPDVAARFGLKAQDATPDMELQVEDLAAPVEADSDGSGTPLPGERARPAL